MARGAMSVTDEEDAVERELQPVACVDGVEEVPRVAVALDDDLPLPLVVVVRELGGEHEEARVDEEGGLDQVAVHGVPPGAPAGLDVQRDPILGMEAVDLVCEGLVAEFAE